MNNQPENEKPLANGVKHARARVDYERLQASRMGSKYSLSLMSRKEKMAGWSHSIDQPFIILFILLVPVAAVNIEILIFNYIFELLDFKTLNFYRY